MCLAAFAINASSRWPLVLASNRDEFFDRPALPLARWQTAAGNTIFSGRDAQAGGTWLGMTPSGRLALLTNVRQGLPLASPRSRGELVMHWLEGSGNADAFAASIDGALYGGFNLVLGDLQSGQWHWWSNRQPGGVRSPLQRLENGIYGLSNAALDTPWTKTVALKAALAKALASPDQFALEESLWKALSRQDRAAQGDLPKTGVPPDLELALSSARVCVADRNYGTRCASLIVLGAVQEKAMPNIHYWAASFKELSYPSLAAVGQSAVDYSQAEVCRFTIPVKSSGEGADEAA
jgi:uncharacterized protein with NRDE domain